MSTQKTSIGIKVAFLLIVVLGTATLLFSTFFISSFFAILGLSLVFWGVILLYIIPSKNVFLGLLNSAVKPNSDNIERILTEYNLSNQGIYLQTENNVGLLGRFTHTNSDLVLVFVPETQKISQELIYLPKKDANRGLYITPPGQALGELFEQRVGKSFSEMSVQNLGKRLTTILTTDLKLAETVDVQTEENTITVEITKSVFEPICQETNNLPKTHKLVGCLLTSAIACIFTKVTGKGITIKNETFDADIRKTKIEYQIIADIKD